MDRKKKIAYSYFDLNREKYYKIINKQLSYGDKKNKIVLNDRLIYDFEFLFGLEETLSYFFEWIISNKKINLPENTQFVYRNLGWMTNEGSLWRDILQIYGVQKPLRWVHSNGKITNVESLV
jgi:hypothetical protein